MNRFTWATSFAVGFALLSGAGIGPGRAQQSELELSLALSQPQFVVGEPVMLRLTMTNRGKTPVQFREMSLVRQTMRFFVRAGDGEWRRYQWPQATDPRLPITVPPGGSSHADQLLHFDYERKALLFPEPGRYAIRAEYVGWASGMPLPPPKEIELTVVAPDPSEAEAAAFFSQRDAADFIAGMTRDAGIVRRFESFLAAHPQSRFAPYARHYLSLHEAMSYSDKPADMARAIALARAADVEGFQLRDRVLVNLGRWLIRAGEPADGAQYLDRVLKLAPQSQAAETARQLKATVPSPK